MAAPDIECWPLLTRLEPDAIADSLIATEAEGVPVGFTTDNPNRLGAILLKPTALERSEGLGQFVVSGQTMPAHYDVTIVIDPFSADGSHGTIELRQITPSDTTATPIY